MEHLEVSQEAEGQTPPPSGAATASAEPVMADATPGAPPPAAPQPAYVYAIGRVEPRFPSLAVEKEFAQVIGRGDMAGLTDREALQRPCPTVPTGIWRVGCAGCFSSRTSRPTC